MPRFYESDSTSRKLSKLIHEIFPNSAASEGALIRVLMACCSKNLYTRLDALIMLYLNLNHPSHPGGPSPKDPGWIYIAYDCRDVSQTKIGITTRPIFDRIFQSTTNTHYILFAGFHISSDFHSELKYIENYIVRELRSNSIPHPTGRVSEWCEILPSDALMMFVEKLPNTRCMEGNEDGYDFTKIIYFPKINHFKLHLSLEMQFNF